jgi:hypothetical protein
LSFYEARDLAIKAVAFAIQNDGSSGGNIRIVDVKRNGVASEEILDNREVRVLVKR